MNKTLAVVVAMSIAATQVGGCASNPSQGMSKTQQGAAVGAVAGGALGAAVAKNSWAGLAIGAALGALAGGLIGNYYDKQDATRAEAAKKYNYDQRTDKLEVESASVAPQTVAPGGVLEAAVQYTTLAPNTTQQIKLTETRTLVSGQESTDLGRREVTRAQGTYTSTAKVTVPKDLPKGNYTLVTTISDGKNTKTAKNQFAVV